MSKIEVKFGVVKMRATVAQHCDGHCQIRKARCKILGEITKWVFACGLFKKKEKRKKKKKKKKRKKEKERKSKTSEMSKAEGSGDQAKEQFKVKIKTMRERK